MPRWRAPIRADCHAARKEFSVSETEAFASYECRVFSLLSKAGFAPNTIFDIGAANGTWSTFVSLVFPDARFEMFEPLAELMPAYQKDLQWQLQCHPKFSLHAVALGAKNGPVSMTVHRDGWGSTLLDAQANPEYPYKREVTQYTLDDYVEEFALPLPDLIKLDTQGSERAILAHGQHCVEHARIVFAEAWFERGYGPETPLITELYELLRAYDYGLAELGGQLYDQEHVLYNVDALFLKRPLLRELRPFMPAGPW
jgi:FkbM family methyltransferase